jgi:small neutral amino acid transporter SnatA (MarC family)
LYIAAAQQHTTIGSVMGAAVISLAMGLILLMAGRHHRGMDGSGSAVQVGDRLVERPSMSKTRRITGLVVIVVSVPFLAVGVLGLLDALLLAIR